jgi:hypothetical protein
VRCREPQSAQHGHFQDSLRKPIGKPNRRSHVVGARAGDDHLRAPVAARPTHQGSPKSARFCGLPDAGVRRSVRESPYAPARRHRPGARAPPGASAGRRWSGSSATGSWGFRSGQGTCSACDASPRRRSAPATARSGRGTRVGAARSTKTSPPSWRAPASSGPTSTRCGRARYASTGPGPVASRSAPTTGIWSGRSSSGRRP